MATLALTTLPLLLAFALTLSGLLTRLLALLIALLLALLLAVLLPAGELLDLPAQALHLGQLLIPVILSGAFLGSVAQRLLSLANAFAHGIHRAIHRRQPSRLIHLIAAAVTDIFGRILDAALHVVLLDFAHAVPQTGRSIRLRGPQIARRSLDILLQLLQIFQVLIQLGCQLLGLLPVQPLPPLPSFELPA